jgi:hypothetical protein
MRMLLNAKRNRTYPNIYVDDRVYRKKSLMDKERVPVWSKVLHTVEKIIEEDGQKLYKVSGYDKAFVRSEILLVND